MKSRNEVTLTLEVLEDRMALSGAFSGAIGAGIPLLGPTSLTPPPNIGQPQAAFRTASVDPIILAQQNQVQNFQSQLQSFEAAQVALMNQIFSELQSLFHFSVVAIV